jgi:phosphinothricin acetyltransferase
MPSTPDSRHARPATLADTPALALIYNEGIEDRVATFEDRPRTPDEIHAWFTPTHPLLVVEEAGDVVAFASASLYRPRACYAGVAECSVYVARAARGRGVGVLALTALLEAAERAGFWKLVGRVFPENEASRRLLRRCGFREVGLYVKHGRLDGRWRDVIIIERLLPANL